MSHLEKFATVDPFKGMNGNNPGKCQNLVSGKWRDEKAVSYTHLRAHET